MTNWTLDDSSGHCVYYSNHITVTHYGDDIPRYMVLYNDEDWVIGEFYPFTDEYVPLEEPHEPQKTFDSAHAAMMYAERLGKERHADDNS